MLIGLQLPSIADGLSACRHGRARRLGRGDQPDRHRRPDRVGLPGDLPAAHAVSQGSGRATRPRHPRAVFVVSWAGMRGAVSLAAALALPLTPKPFPDRDLVIFLTFCVILATLVGQGLTLPLARPAARGRGNGRARTRRRPRHGWRRSRRRSGGWTTSRASTRATGSSSTSCARATSTRRATSAPSDGGPRDEAEQELLDHLEIRTAVLDAEREAVIRPARRRDHRRRGAACAIERDLDLEALRSGA